jgi:hypothetical protein
MLIDYISVFQTFLICGTMSMYRYIAKEKFGINFKSILPTKISGNPVGNHYVVEPIGKF